MTNRLRPLPITIAAAAIINLIEAPATIVMTFPALLPAMFLIVASWSNWLTALLLLLLQFILKQSLGQALNVRTLRRLRRFAIHEFPNTQFSEQPLDSYLGALLVERVERETVKTALRADFVLPLKARVIVGDAFPAALVQIFVHRTDVGRRPTTYFCFDNPVSTGFVFSSVAPNEVSPLRRFFIFHEIGHCVQANKFRRIRAVKTFSGVVVFLMLSVFQLSAASVLIAMMYAGIGIALWRQPSRTREVIADLFAVRNISPSDAKRIVQAIKNRPSLFYDPTIGGDIHNKIRIKRLSELLEMKINDSEMLDAVSDLRAYAYADPFMLRVVHFVIGISIIYLEWIVFRSGISLPMLSLLILNIVAFLCANLIVASMGPAFVDLYRRLDCIQRLPLWGRDKPLKIKD